ncbi:MAG: hypothetical protein H0W97_09415, partial [Actinobacteria bacterium]|nr:hypothetical protein [Actinomycetota bacterium]
MGRRPPTGTSGARASPGRRPTAPTTFATPSSSSSSSRAEAARLSGPVDVCVAVPKLALDRPFTYELSEGWDAGVGSLVSVRFHGRTVKGWILGRALDPPAGRILPIRALRSPVRFFDARHLALLRWVSERYLAPLAMVIERSHPPRVADVERGAEGAVENGGPDRSRSARPGPPAGSPVLERYGGAGNLLRPGVSVWLRPLPSDEAGVALAGVEACVAAGRRALVLVP